MMVDLAMGEHGLYVWIAYSLAAVAYIWLVGWPLYCHRRFFRQSWLSQRLAQSNTQSKFNQPNVPNVDDE